jgi:hypothetical protein
VQIARGVRAIVAAVCWTAAVVVGLVTVAAYVGSGTECVRQTTGCGSPNATALLIGMAVAIVLGVIGAAIWKPRPEKRRPRRPWDYLD